MRRSIFLLVVAACLGAGVAYGASTLTADQGTTVCVNNNSNGVNGRFVNSASDCRSSETAHQLVGPGGSVAHANEADHATEADNADTLDGHDSSEFMRGYLRQSASITTPPGATVSWDSNCNVGLEALSFGVGVTNIGSLSPRPIVEDNGETSDAATGHWFIVIENRDPDTPMTTFAHSQCFDAAGASAAAFAAPSGPSGPVAHEEG